LSFGQCCLQFRRLHTAAALDQAVVAIQLDLDRTHQTRVTDHNASVAEATRLQNSLTKADEEMDAAKQQARVDFYSQKASFELAIEQELYEREGWFQHVWDNWSWAGYGDALLHSIDTLTDLTGGPVGQPGLIEGFLPVWGSGRAAIDDFQNGRWGWGLANSGFVALDLYTLGAATPLRHAAMRGLRSAGRWVARNSDTIASKAADVAGWVMRLGRAAEKFCFSPDTPVWTETGKKRIADVAPGERVWSFDFDAGGWVLSDVLQRHDNRYSGPMVTIAFDDCRIEATANHPFWVVEGEQLAARGDAGQLQPGEDEGRA